MSGYNNEELSKLKEQAFDWVDDSGRFYSNAFTDFLFPVLREERAMHHQWINDLIEPSMKMKGMIDAGINPNTAAREISGAAAQSSAPMPSSSDSPISEIASLASGSEALANAYKVEQEGNNVTPLAQSSIRKNDAEIDKWSHDNGFTDVQASAFKIDNLTRDDRNRADLAVKRQQYNVMVADADRIMSQKAYVDKQLSWYDKQIEATIALTEKRALEAEKHAFQIEEQTRTEKMENDFAEKHKYRRDSPFDVAMLSCWFEGNYDKVKSAQDFMYNLKYGIAAAESEGNYEMQAKFAYQIANAQETARSLNQIVTDWSTPATGLWSLLEKSFNISGNKGSANTIGNAFDAKSNPDAYSGYSSFLLGLQLSLDDINAQIDAASSHNEFSKVRQLTRQRDGLQKFINDLSFEKYNSHIHSKQ